jgi:NAD(P)-dependent dehydrogenase (short-subunit alcohol dehydrogenase family)
MYPDKLFITGYTGGLGSELVKSWDEKDIVKIGRQPDADILCDFKEPGEVRTRMDWYLYDHRDCTEEKIGMVLSAGSLGESPTSLYCPSEWFKLTDYSEVYNINVLSHLAIIRGLIPLMIQAQYGRIVWLAGGGAAYGYPELFAYSLSKVAVVRAVENIAMELADKIEDFSIIALAPGAMETPMLEKVRKAGGIVKTTTDIKEPVTFINRFLQTGKFMANALSGKFIHVRDDLNVMLETSDRDKLWKLRRIEK